MPSNTVKLHRRTGRSALLPERGAPPAGSPPATSDLNFSSSSLLLLAHAMPPSFEADARAGFAAAVRGAGADALLNRFPWAEEAPHLPSCDQTVRLVAMGKAALPMTGEAARQLSALGAAPSARGESMAVVPEGYPKTRPGCSEGVAVFEGGHPVPTEASVRAGRRALALAERSAKGDLLVVLLSGGGTALCNALAESVSLADARRTFALLLESGADIHAMNTVRKHLSRVGGGRLAEAAAPARVLGLALSDVPGDDLSVIASGPTVPDPTTFADAAAVLGERGCWEQVPSSVRRHVERGVAGAVPETPGPGAACFRTARTRLIGSNADALEAAQTALQALLLGGETTVTVRGAGTGGRSQELALAAALELEARRSGSHAASLALLAAGTDGIDGPTDAAGAVVTAQTASAIRARGLDPEACLADNDAHPALDAAGALVRPGPTHTNVMDVAAVLVK